MRWYREASLKHQLAAAVAKQALVRLRLEVRLTRSIAKLSGHDTTLLGSDMDRLTDVLRGCEYDVSRLLGPEA